MELTIDKVITLQNEEQYIIIDNVVSRGIRYYYIAGVDKEKQVLNGVCKIVKIVDGDKVKFIDNKDELSVIFPLFMSHYV